MKFIQRLETPKKTNKYYIHKTGGGYNKAKRINGNDVLPNCVGYAYGRFMEAQEIKTSKLPTSNAESQIDDNTYYKEGNIAKVGAVIVWKQGKIHYSKDGAGHVAIVEEIYPDGSILVSQSAYKGKRFYLTTHNNKYYKKGYQFVGFIYPEKTFDDTLPNDISEMDERLYELLYEKYIRTQPKVANNIVKVGECFKSVQEKLTSKIRSAPAKFKIGSHVMINSFYHDNKGNIWGKMTNSYICVKDKTGMQVKKL